MGRLYRCLRAVVRAVTPRMTTSWEEPFSGNPSVFVCNHVGAAVRRAAGGVSALLGRVGAGGGFGV